MRLDVILWERWWDLFWSSQFLFIYLGTSHQAFSIKVLFKYSKEIDDLYCTLVLGWTSTREFLFCPTCGWCLCFYQLSRSDIWFWWQKCEVISPFSEGSGREGKKMWVCSRAAVVHNGWWNFIKQHSRVQIGCCNAIVNLNPTGKLGRRWGAPGKQTCKSTVHYCVCSENVEIRLVGMNVILCCICETLLVVVRPDHGFHFIF